MELFEDTRLARPFIKWVGGKTQLLDEVKKSLPCDFAQRQHITYVEPFVGGGAVMFWILQAYPNIERAVINDINEELICTYRVIKRDVDALITELAAIQSEYIPLNSNARKDFFLAKRALFNTKKITPIQTAALFIFLNRTCFNGLYRVNSKGEFNVPHGKYMNPRICDAANLRSCSEVLQKVEILCGDFAETGRYAKEGFDDREQIRLRDFCDQISKDEALFIASNSDPKDVNPQEEFFDTIYKHFFIKRVSAARMINSDATGRGAISELIISNVVNA